MTAREWQRTLEAKRKRESEEILRRLQEARASFLNSQDFLRKLLKEKNERTELHLENVIRTRNATIKEQRDCEERKNQEVMKATEVLLNRDTQYRKAM